MEGILFIGGVVLLVLILRANSQRRRDREEDQKRWEELAARLSTLERVIDKPRPATTNSVAPSLPRAVETQPAELQSPPPLPPPEVQPASPTRIAAENWVTQRQTPSESTRPAAQDQPIPSSPNVVQPPPSASPPEPAFSSIETPPSFANRLTSSHDIEEMLGTNWLNKLGIVILVLGIAFFLAYQLKTLGPFGKILVGFATASALLGAGIWFDRAERYRILARAGVGGGWALFFFTTYAMYHVPAAQVLSSQVTDLLMLLVVAGMMVAHTLRYRSQVVTGLSFLLAFLTVAISHSNVYSLSAGAVLAAALVVIVGRMQWFALELFGIVASYFNHYLWLRPIIEPMHGKRHAFPEFTASAGMLILYWAIFRVSYILRQPSSERQEHVSSAAALLNTALLLLLFNINLFIPNGHSGRYLSSAELKLF